MYIKETAMIFKCESYESLQKKASQWHRSFALLPKRVGTDQNGKGIWAWLQWIEVREEKSTLYRRLPNSDAGYSKAIY
jgi:hypothetical protein